MLRLFRVTQFSRVKSLPRLDVLALAIGLFADRLALYIVYSHRAAQRCKKLELASIYCVQSFGIYMVKVFADSVCGRHGTTLGGDTLDDREITRLWLQHSLQPVAKCTILCIHSPIEVDVAIFTRFILCNQNHPIPNHPYNKLKQSITQLWVDGLNLFPLCLSYEASVLYIIAQISIEGSKRKGQVTAFKVYNCNLSYSFCYIRTGYSYYTSPYMDGKVSGFYCCHQKTQLQT